MELLYNDKEYIVVNNALLEAENNQAENAGLAAELGEYETKGKKGNWGNFDKSELYTKVAQSISDFGEDPV